MSSDLISRLFGSLVSFEQIGWEVRFWCIFWEVHKSFQSAAPRSQTFECWWFLVCQFTRRPTSAAACFFAISLQLVVIVPTLRLRLSLDLDSLEKDP
ncbi:unnamed protein product [Lathyrus sativus]|nr:unnamed protein product [Lathyrus sativus]